MMVSMVALALYSLLPRFKHWLTRWLIWAVASVMVLSRISGIYYRTNEKAPCGAFLMGLRLQLLVSVLVNFLHRLYILHNNYH